MKMVNGIRRKWKIRRAYLFLFGLLLFGSGFVSTADEGKEQVLMELQADAEVHEEAKEESPVIATLPEGTAIICTETESEIWYQMSYQDIKGFVLAETLGLYGDAEGLNEEFEEIQEDDGYQFGVIEEGQRQKKSQFLWGGIMVLLVVLMFATGVYTVLRNKKKESDSHPEKDTREE